ncbi:hypothetical protein AAG906_004031 [Vitis piasezkii]
MTDWGPVVVATVLFVLLTPGLLCQIPGRGRVVEFGNMSTSGLSILVHAVIYFALVTIFVIAVSMADWGPVIVATVLFVLLTPGLLFQIPAKGRLVEFGNMSTSGLSILVHTVIYLVVLTIFLIVLGVHIYTNSG